MTPRRDFLSLTAGAMAAAALPGGAKADNPDADLLAMCENFRALQAQFPSWNGAAHGSEQDTANEAATYAVIEGQSAILQSIVGIPAATWQGMQAKAQVVLLWDGKNAYSGKEDDCAGDQLVASLLRDVLA